MSAPKNDDNDIFSEIAIDDPYKKIAIKSAIEQWELIEPVIQYAFFQRKEKGRLWFLENPNEPIEHTIIKILSDLVLKSFLRRKKQKKGIPPIDRMSEIVDLFKVADPEIRSIYSAIKEIGFSVKLTDPEEKWRTASLKRFDDSRTGFQLIRREYLEDKALYILTTGKERRDFEGRLLKKIVKDYLGIDSGIDSLRSILKGMKTDKK